MKTTEGRKVAISGGALRYIEPGMFVATKVTGLPGWYRVAAMNRTSARLVTSEPKWNPDGSLRIPGSTSPVPFTKITRVSAT